ncbi:MAG: ATP-binding protein [Rectinemataceae bacterium]
MTTDLKADLALFPAVALIGPRQCGKSRLAAKIAEFYPGSLRLDLENPRDRAKLSDPQLYFESNASRFVCIDEIQLIPELFPVLRAEIDRDRRPGRFLILGSASRALVNRSAESLAGRIGYRELTPFSPMEYLAGSPPSVLETLSRGAFPESALATNGEASLRWRESFLKSIVERDLPMLGSRVSAIAMERFLTMCAHLQSQVLNAAKLGASLDLAGPSVRARLDFLQEALFVRLLPPWEGNLKKRLIKSPKLYIRDSGLCHALLGIGSVDDLLGHPVFGSSWEAFCIETLCSSFPEWRPSFYRSSGGAEIDLVLERGSRRLAFECKASSAPTLTRGFYSAIDDLQPEHTYVVCVIDGSYPLARGVTACGIRECAELFFARGK